jgi:hypothetical protein
MSTSTLIYCVYVFCNFEIIKLMNHFNIRFEDLVVDRL